MAENDGVIGTQPGLLPALYYLICSLIPIAQHLLNSKLHDCLRPVLCFLWTRLCFVLTDGLQAIGCYRGLCVPFSHRGRLHSGSAET